VGLAWGTEEVIYLGRFLAWIIHWKKGRLE
jgi:hypothetical protein